MMHFNTTGVRVLTPNIKQPIKKILLPVRANLLGGWTDQLLWERPAAVINFAMGWHGGFENLYPLLTTRKKIDSKIEGIGTGLGISSILAAAKFLLDCPDGDYVGHTLDWEWKNGTKGGWQDQIGAIQPGFKLISTSDRKNFTIQNRDDHPILERIVLEYIDDLHAHIYKGK